ncbi:ParA family protein [Mesorhizobium sp. B4-1-3]|uniref:ParA family protein n=1 Tax=Mesorhizobium sp. B4-1-3 TaxID=2589889 RepID=UPI00112A1F9C|nr:AAA family ATPase [Mesorhizobium sp. B4-1-3]TPI10848.1 ParA family protein [Mesorhizobium sp. B4-1-3]
MTAYGFWNNKGGVGKSYLSFVAACEYAHNHPDTDVFILDLCPQANSSEILLGSDELSLNYTKLLLGPVRKSIGGYIERRLNSPFINNTDYRDFTISPVEYNKHIPENVRLVAGDYIMEVFSEAMRQAAQLSIPLDAWKKVINWIRDLVVQIRADYGLRETMFVIDCNPSFSIYTQMALVASEKLIIPFTADDSSRRAIENVFALLYGIGDEKTQAYARISFAAKANNEQVNIPKIHTFINNRVTLYEGKPSAAFRAASLRVKDTVDRNFKGHKSLFDSYALSHQKEFIEVPDYHSAAIVSTLLGMPVHKLRPGPKKIKGEQIQLNKDPLDRYRKALAGFVARL